MITEIFEHQMLDEKIDYFVYMLCLCKDLSVSCFLTFIGRPNAIQIYTKFKYNMKSCKILSIKLLFFFLILHSKPHCSFYLSAGFFPEQFLVTALTVRPEKVYIWYHGYFVFGSLPQSRGQK